MILRFVLAGAVFWLAFDGGSYALESRHSIAIALWWAVLIAVGVGLLPLARPSRGAVGVGGLLAAFAGLTGASIAWSASAERALLELDRAALYLGIFLLAVLAATRSTAARIADGLALGIVAIGGLALTSRFFPHLLDTGDLPQFLPGAASRLSYPLDYWNGLAILLALAVPLLLRPAVAAASPLGRGLAAAPLPALAAAVYLSSSRGGAATAIVGAVAFCIATAHRWLAMGAVAAGALGSAAIVAVLEARPELVDGPLTSQAAASQGRSAAVLLVLVCAATGLVYASASRRLGRLPRLRPAATWAAATAALVLVVAGVAASDPVERFETFKRPPDAIAEARPGFVREHLLSAGGSGRWQFWQAALREFESRPLEGRGAGSFEAWWAQHGTLATFVRDAHSLYLETLGELGAAGLALLVGAFGVGLAAGIGRVAKADAAERPTAAALLAGFVAYLVAAGIDWMWEMTVVSLVGLALLGMLVGPATRPPWQPRVVAARDRPAPARRFRFAAGVAALLAAWAVVCAEAVPLLAHEKLDASRAAVRRGEARDALDDALAAHNLEPWAASPYLQLALVEEQAGALRRADAHIRRALERDPLDWRLWLVAARLQTKSGAVALARRSLARAAELNPRSPLFAKER